ncbi:MJ0042-type zinc finger domain-containing protein [Ponticaulis sp.]|uniref:MJ0042-type zinc finger domain-containing protein n=1 Tax=Ponticaulis sp. TaxID=2020902 RepID=UPI0025E8EA45|nr:MJ0042-type zinc finger domain-containing protein [Ponticaulis sp.]
MILTCPSCSAQYFADDKAIGAQGRTVRCASCSHSWYVRPELSLEEEISKADFSREKVERQRQAMGTTSAPTAPHLAIREKKFARQANGARMAAIGAWAGTAAIFFAIGGAAIVNRDAVVRMMPEASSAYAMVGLEANPFGLEFADVSADRELEGTMPVLTVSGSILNVSNRAQIVPNVRVDLRDDLGVQVESILITPDESSVVPGGEVYFTTRLDSPSLAAYDLAVSFVQSESNVRLVANGHGVEDVHHSTDAAHDTQSDGEHATDGHDAADGHETVDSHAAADDHAVDMSHNDGHGEDTAHHDTVADHGEDSHEPSHH